MNTGFSIDEIMDGSKNLSKFILNNVSSKLPIKQSEMMEVVNTKNKYMFQRILTQTKSFLLDCHGLDLIEVSEIKSAKHFIVISTLSSGSALDFTDDQKGEMTLLFLILSYIFMKGNPISEDNLIQYLSKLKINVDEPHPFFGDNLKKSISQSFVKKLYLKRDKDKSINAAIDENYLYSWGYRSTLEFPKYKILDLVAQIMGKPSICFVRQHLEIAGNSENENMEIEIN